MANVVSLTALAWDADFFSVAKKGLFYMNVFVAGIRDDTFEAVHLPEVPGNDFGDFTGLILGGCLAEFVLVIVKEGVEGVFAGKEEVISLPFVAVSSLVSQLGSGVPFFLRGRVLCYYAEFAAQKSNALSYGDDVAGDGIVAADEVRSLAAGDLQTDVGYIVLPGLAVLGGKFYRVGVGFPAFIGFLVEGAIAAKPLGINEVVLGVADPGRGEDFTFVTNTGLLLLLSLADAGLDDVAVVAGDGLYVDLLAFGIFGAKRLVIVGGPNDVCGFLAVLGTAMVGEKVFEQ